MPSSVLYLWRRIKNNFTYLNGMSRAHDGITKAFTYFDDDKLKGYTVGSDNDYLSVSNFTYDTLDRVSKIEYTNSGNGSDVDISVSYGYATDTTYGTSGRITSYSVYVDGNMTSYAYYYNDDGNITKITSSDGRSIVYTYDSLGQLISEDNDFTGYYYTYTYDKAGNLTQTSYRLQGSSSGGGIEFNGIDGDASVLALKPDLPPLNPTTYNTYTYTDSQWGDLLTSYNGTAIEYDEIGNPTSYYNGYSYSFAWEGRRLVSAVKGTNSMSFAYNDAGLRISKTANYLTTHYVYDGSLLAAEYTNNETIVYIYDAFDSPIGFAYRSSSYSEDTWDVYWYEKNLQGDIVAVYSSTGTKLVSYTYTAWGDFTITYHNGGASTTAVNNRLTYRGYYYDSDLGMYYLQSRYYDPVICRFISPDYPDVITASPAALTDKNLFAYCDNNPVMRVDYDGMFWGTLFDVISLGFSIYDVYTNPDDIWAWVGLAGDIIDLLPVISGVGEATDLLRISNGADNLIDAGRASNRISEASETAGKVAKKIHGNSLKSTKETVGYALRKIDTEEIMKYGETTRGVRRYTKNFYKENGVYMEIMEHGSKYDMHFWQHNKILEYKAKYGVRPPWNKSDW